MPEGCPGMFSRAIPNTQARHERQPISALQSLIDAALKRDHNNQGENPPNTQTTTKTTRLEEQ